MLFISIYSQHLSLYSVLGVNLNLNSNLRKTLLTLIDYYSETGPSLTTHF